MKHNRSVILRTHSYYGFFESTISPEALVHTAQAKGIETLGLTDHHFLTGSIEFYESCQSAGINPILGLEIDTALNEFSGRIALLAKDRQGWANLSLLSSDSLKSPTPLRLAHVCQHHEGLICLLGGPQSLLRELMISSPVSGNLQGQYLSLLRESFGEDCFIEIQRFASGPLKSESDLLRLSQTYETPLVATQSIHYLESQDRQLLRTLAAIKKNSTLHGLAVKDLPEGDPYFPSYPDFTHRYQDLPQALDNLQIISGLCCLDLPIGKTHYPQFPTPEGQTQAELLRSRAYQGALEKYGAVTQEIAQHLDHELEPPMHDASAEQLKTRFVAALSPRTAM